MKSGVCLLVFGFLTAIGASAAAQTPGPVQFNRDVRPILADRCFACHGPDARARKADLRLDIREIALQRNAFVPGDPKKSHLVQRIRSKSVAQVMPPASFPKKLTAQQQDILERWIKEGARYEAHWSYIPPKRPPVPTLAKANVRNPIDAFIRAKLAEKGLQPSPQADRRTLIRRLYLDLVGIPPTPKDVQAYLNDKSDRAYEKVVDHLLASPHYGERMAIPWLDVVRYADTVGFHGDQNQNAWAYRDYVIKSFNEDKPFDRFTIEQLAGDLLPDPTPVTRTATCFNRLNMVTREGGAQPREYMAKYAADRVRTVSMAWLGSTFGCSECHDHKYDPITQRDFYSLAAFFADLKQWGVYADYEYTPNPDLKGIGNDHPFPPEIRVESSYLAQRIQRNRKRIADLAEAYRKQCAADDAGMKALQDWKARTADFLNRNPSGWVIPPLDVLTATGLPSAAKAFGEPQKDGSILLTAEAPVESTVSAAPSPGWISTVKIELLPHEANGGSILRQGAGGLLRVALAVKSPEGKARPLGVRYASANFALSRFADSFEIIGIQGGWSLDAARTKEAHDSLWLLDSPVELKAGEKLFATFRGVRVGCVRISTSPLGLANPEDREVPAAAIADLRKMETAPTALAVESYLRGTAADSKQYAQLKSLESDILECRRGITPVMVTETVKPMILRVLPRGNWQDESGPVVEPAIPHFLPQDNVPKARRLTRLDLANWLVSAENPLTARMFVNRLWKQFFGTALSDKVEDLGTQGEWPTNPELLDWLAVEFRQPVVQEIQNPESKIQNLKPWSIKHIVRLILTSETYKQSSKPTPQALRLDPQNRLLASQNPRRLEAELVRDNALEIAGLLNKDIGGPPCKPYQPAGYYANLQFPDRDYIADTDDRQWRRGVYMHWQRTFLHPMLANFDAPSREECTGQRTQGNTPQQALTLLNDPEFVEAAKAFAARLMAAPGSDAERLERAYQLALSRSIKANERDSLLGFLAKARSAYKALPEDARKLLAVGFMAPPAGDEIELAAWTSVARVILNLHETITRY